MKKASLFASAAVASVAFAGVPAFAQTGGGPFADVPTDHWAYGSVDRLQREGIVIGYPDGTFGGKRAMTRYEFAVAIARMLEKVGQQPDLSNYVTRDQLNAAIAGLATKDEVAQIRRLVQEFQNELTTLGVDLDATKRRLDALEGRVGALENEFKRVRIGGAVNLMARGNHRTNSGTRGIIDRDGFRVTGGRGSRGGILADTRVLHDLDLSVRARLSETATAEAVINFGNYLDFLNSVASFSGARSDRTGNLNPALNQFVSQDQTQTIYKLALEAPVRLPGLGGVNLAVGRIPIQFTPYTLRLIDVDSYFYNDKTDLGDIPVDGARGAFKIGPVGITAFAAKSDPVKHVSNVNGKIVGDGNYGLFAGAGFSPYRTGAGGFGFRGNSVPYVDENGGVTVTGNRPTGSPIAPNRNGAMWVENLGGVRATFGSSGLGTIGATYLALGGTSSPAGTAAPGSLAEFDRVYVYGADINTNFSGIGITGAYTRSDTRSARGETGGDTRKRRDDDTDAWDVGLSYATGALSFGAGYKEIGPFFGAPGFWAKLGSYTNPVDIKGPYVSASYALGGGVTLAAEGHFYEGTGRAVNQGGLSKNDGITNYKAGLKYGLTSASSVDLGVEYTTYDLNNAARDPREVFYNIGYGFSFNPTTSFKLLYQIVDYNDKGTGFDTQNRKGGVAAAQFSVKF